MGSFRCYDNSGVIAALMMTNFHLNTTVVSIFTNVCFWRRSLCSDLVFTLKNCIEPPSYARTVCCNSFVIIWATCEISWGKWFNGFHPIQYISVSCKLAQWQVADPVAFYTRRMTIIFGISGYVKLVTLYCHTIFWETEGFGEGCVKIMQIVSCLELMTNLFIFIHNRKM